MILPGNKVRILLVDDFRTNVVYLKSLLEREGYTIITACDTDLAAELICQLPFDLILLDIEMPKMDGYALCERVRQSDPNQNTPVIFITSRTDQQSILKGFDTGAQDYVTRPFSERELLARVNTHIHLKLRTAALEIMNRDLEKMVDERTARLKALIDKLHASNTALEKAKSELESLDSAKEHFLKIINHEIRTPLNGILGFQELLKEAMLDAKYAGYLEMMNRSVRRLEKFSILALMITQLRTGKYRPSHDQVRIDRKVEQILGEFESEYGQKSLHIEINLGHTTGFIDDQLFHQLICQLLEIAICQTERQGMISITGGERSGNRYGLSIINTGKGYSESVLKNMNNLFSNDDFIDSDPGLLFHASRLILQTMQGGLMVFNNPQGGATIEVDFSLDAAHGSPEEVQKMNMGG
jgi:DNA-binding response OmpR family regulator